MACGTSSRIFYTCLFANLGSSYRVEDPATLPGKLNGDNLKSLGIFEGLKNLKCELVNQLLRVRQFCNVANYVDSADGKR